MAGSSNAAEFRNVRVGDVSWGVCIEGQGPPLLLLHGFTGSHRSFDDVVKHLRDICTVVRVDLPGHGATRTVSGRDCTMEEASDSLHRLMNELGFLSYGVVGYSFGGRVAISLACRHTTDVLLLVLESSSPGIDDVAERTKRRDADRALASHIEAVPLAEFIEEWSQIPLFRTQHRLTPESRTKQASIRHAQTTEGLASSLRGMGTGEQPSYWHLLNNLQMPVCIIVGEEDEKFCKIADQMGNLLPNATIRVVEEAGHTVHLEQPGRYTKAVVSFIQTILEETI